MGCGGSKLKELENKMADVAIDAAVEVGKVAVDAAAVIIKEATKAAAEVAKDAAAVAVAEAKEAIAEVKEAISAGEFEGQHAPHKEALGTVEEEVPAPTAEKL